MNLKKRILIGIFTVGAVVASAVPTVSDVTAKQRYPWNGLVDITCKVTGISGTYSGYKFTLAAVMQGSGEVHKVWQFWVVKNGVNSTDKKVQANGTYKLLWDARADLGAVVHSNMVMRVNVVDHDKVQLWAGGPYWADTNIGAEEPEEHGYYFWWGDTIGYKRENNMWVATDGSSSNFSFGSSNTPTFGKDISTLKSERWITADSVLTPEHDAAHVHWGGNWRMPTDQEQYDLRIKCSWCWTKMNGVQGYLVNGKGDYASNSIFLPCAGYGDGTSLNDSGSDGDYWSSVPTSGYYYSKYLSFYWVTPYSSNNYRNNGFSVRPVHGFTE